MIGILAAAALMASAQVPPEQQASSAPPQEPGATQLEDVTVTGRTLDQLVGKFVEEVAEPNRGRGLARWRDGVCVGVANLRPDTAQYIVDRVSTVAEDVGLRPGRPGCAPNVLIVATDDSSALARGMVSARPVSFRMGGGGMDRGSSALKDFQEADRPIRWWQVSMPVDADSGVRATRIPGDCDPRTCNNASGSVLGFAPIIPVFAASRLHTQIVDNIFRTVVIIDMDDVAGLTALQVADYIAMVSLAQIDPDADTGAYASILNVFEEGSDIPTLTGWDKAYLAGLYRAERNELNRAAGLQEVEGSILRAHARARAGQSEN
ncbi:MAG: hypothetical protein EON89_00570 [Brevundimonas sp.]|nr:MAG: hypothetical protein EON89_00570 [Brevundimonas sp.]